MRLIDAECDAIVETIGRIKFNTRKDIQDWLDSAPTIDAVEVVRCRDCKHLVICNNKLLYAICEKTGYGFRPFDTDTRTHFCAFGEFKIKED